MINDRAVAFWFRAIGVVAITAGLVSHLGILRGEFEAGAFMYYTILSNALALVLFALLAVRTWRSWRTDGRAGSCSFLPRFEMVCAVDLMLTLIVYWVLLAPGAFSMDGSYHPWSPENLALHLITPALPLVDYLLFAHSGELRPRDAFLVLAFPLAYLIFSSAAGMAGYEYRLTEDGQAESFPYFFMDWGSLGWGVLAYVAVIAAFLLALAGSLIALDRLWKRPRRAVAGL